MAIRGSQELRAELDAVRKGKGRSVYLLFGSEPFLVRTATEAIVGALAEVTDAEVVRTDAEGKPAAFVLEPVASLSLFASTRIVVVRNFAHLLTGDEADRLLDGLAHVGEGSALVLAATGGDGDRIDKRVKGYKGLVRRGAVLELNQQKPDALALWLRDRAKDDGKELAPEAAQLLLDRVGPDMEMLGTELEKAVLYCHDRDRIAAADLVDLVGKSREDAVWDITEAVARRDPVRAMMLVEDLLATGTYPLVLLTLLVRQARHLLQARLLWEAAGSPSFRDIGGFRSRVQGTFESGVFGKGPDDVTSIHPFASFKRFEAARGHGIAELRALVARLRRADRDAKTGASAGPREVLEELVLDLCTGGRRAA